MKKILISILAISLLAGCSFNEKFDEDGNVSNNEKEKINYENYVSDSATYLKTIEKKITLSDKEIDLAFIYSYDAFVGGEYQYQLLETLLFNGKIFSSEFNNVFITGINSVKLSDIKGYEINDAGIEIIKDIKTTDEYLLIQKNDSCSPTGCNHKVYIINKESNIILSEEYADCYSVKLPNSESNEEYVQISDNVITIYKDAEINKILIENGKIKKQITKYPEGTEISGCMR